MGKKLCTVEGCERPFLAKGYCSRHYQLLVQKPRSAVNDCGCGCGEKTKFTFKWGHHTRLFTSEEQSRRGQMNDGSWKRDTGTADWYRKVRGRHEHRRVMEAILGRPLLPNEIVHHKDRNKKNNDPSNLELMTRADHMKHHLHGGSE